MFWYLKNDIYPLYLIPYTRKIWIDSLASDRPKCKCAKGNRDLKPPAHIPTSGALAGYQSQHPFTMPLWAAYALRLRTIFQISKPHGRSVGLSLPLPIGV